MSNTKDLDYAYGETWVMPFEIQDADENPIDCTGASATWLLQDLDTFATVLSATVGGGITWTTQNQGLGQIAVTAAMQTSAAVLPGTYRHLLTATLSDGTVSDQTIGLFIVTQRGAIAGFGGE
ncbi:MAG: hypothetical protein ACJ8AD_14845 [Gemmatimonadaceae bacterium]